jgi:hypothetical protein
MRDYPTLHLNINKSKETDCSKKSYGSKRTRENIPHKTYLSVMWDSYLCLSVMLDSLSCSFRSI